MAVDRPTRRCVVERRGPVGWLIFDRPDAGNAMDATMLAELEQAWLELDADPDVRVIVNTGNGSAFQTGLDVVQLAATARPCASSPGGPSDAELRLTAWHNQVWKPVIAAVNGVCAGGGLHFVADADIVIAASTPPSSTPTCRSARSPPTRPSRLVRKSPVESIMRMALVGRHERHDRRAGLPARDRSARSSTRPSGCATRPRRWPRRSPGTRRRPWRPPSGPCGARSSWA